MSHGGGELECSKSHYRSQGLSKDNFLVVLSRDGNKNLAGLTNFNFRIL